MQEYTRLCDRCGAKLPMFGKGVGITMKIRAIDHDLCDGCATQFDILWEQFLKSSRPAATVVDDPQDDD